MAQQFIQTVTKKWYQSKLIWLNIGAGLLEIFNLFDENILELIGFQKDTASRVVHGLALAASIITVILRLNGKGTVISALPANTVVGIDKSPVIEPQAPVTEKMADTGSNPS